MKCDRMLRHAGAWCALAVMIVIMGAVQARAQCLEQQKLTASDADALDGFGSAVSVSGNTAMVGGAGDDCAVGLRCGAAYMFRFNGTFWVQEQKLTASDAAHDARFGISVSVDGDTAVVGAFFDHCASDLRCGSAYVFRFNGISWVQEQKLAASDATHEAMFGISVSVSGDTIVVGASRSACAVGESCGSAYVFRFNGASWVEEQKLTASDAGSDDFFGTAVSLNGNTVVLGAPRNTCATGDVCGAAYVFRFNGTTWVERQKLVAPERAHLEFFGLSVSLSGVWVVLGANFDSCAGGERSGSAYAFRFDGISWVLEQRLTASDAAPCDNFGRSVSISGGTTVVGAYGAECATGADCRAAYVFRFDGNSWVEEQKLTTGSAGYEFGISVSASGDAVGMGTASEDCAAGEYCGAVHMFSCASSPADVVLDIKPGSCPNMVNPRSRGVVPVAIVGSSDFDVAEIDPGSLTLARADGVGSSVSPLSGPPGPGIVIEDVATPFAGERCACHAFGGDGIDDLSLKFSMPDIRREFQLNAPRGRTQIELVLRGSLQDGTTFEGVDCMVLPRRARVLTK